MGIVIERRGSVDGAGTEGIGCSGAVLAGGESRRFGRDKARAELAGKPLVSYVVEKLQTLFEDVLIISNQPVAYEGFHVTVVSDIVRGAGSLGGLLTALVHAQEERCFVAACDMPFIQVDLVRRMVDRCKGFDVVVPEAGEELQPLHAIYSKRCVGPIQQMIAEGDFRIFDFYPQVLTLRLEERLWAELDPESRSFSNINTLQDLDRAQKWIEGLEQRDDGPRK